jgi:hypothetical protein
MIFDHLDPTDFKKARKSLLVVSLCTLFFATLQIDEGSKIEVFKFVLLVSQNKLVKLGQIATLLLSIVFIIKMIPNTLAVLKVSWLSRLSKIDRQEDLNLQYSWGWDESDHFDGSPEGEIKELESRQGYRRTKSEKFFERNLALTNTIASLLLDIFLPLTLAVFAIFCPYYLAQSVQTDEAQLFMLGRPSNQTVKVDEILDPKLTYGPKLPPHLVEGGR